MSSREFYTYNILDSMGSLEAFPGIMDVICKENNIDAYDSAVSLLQPLMAMQYRGMRFDNEGVKIQSDQAEIKIAELNERLASVAGRPLNVNSHTQLKAYFYDHLGIKPYISRGTKQISTNEEALIRIARQGYEEAKIVLENRQLRKLKGTYLDVLLDADGRLRGSADPAGTSTGRLAVRKTQERTGLNTQTLPHSLYPYILADEDYILYSIDLSQAENRVVAYIAPEPAMIRAFENKIDIHRQTAALIFQKPMELIEYDERQMGKKSNHGLNYGLGYKSFAIIHQLQEAFSKWVVESYHRVYPGVRLWHEALKKELGADRILSNLFGRRRRFYTKWGDDLFKDAYSYIPQSTVGEMINRRAMLFLYYNTDPIFQPVEMLNNMHDGLWYQIPISIGLDKHEHINRALRASLEAPLKYKAYEFSIPLDCKAGFNLGDYMSEEEARKHNEEHPENLQVANIKGSKKLNWDKPLVPQLEDIIRLAKGEQDGQQNLCGNSPAVEQEV